MKKSFETINEVKGPLLVVSLPKGENIKYEEIAEVELADGTKRLGKVLTTGEDYAIVQMFLDNKGLSADETRVSFVGRTLDIPVSKDMLGRVFNGIGKPIDGYGEIIPEKYIDINGSAINPAARKYPDNFIQTGITSIDLLNSLVRGQKLPIFSGSGLPHNKIATQIARQAKVRDGSSFAIVFGAMGVPFEEAESFIDDFKKTGAIEHSVMFVNIADDPVIERISTPRMALATAEYLAFEHDMHVLVILTDMTNYCEALREVSAALRQVPGRRGFPGYMYSDLSSIYERSGCVHGKKGTVTQIPILTMPDDDKTHPIPNLTGYITEGQFYLNRTYMTNNIEPPIDPMSLSRLKNEGIGEGKTRDDHKAVSDQIVSAYSEGLKLRDIAVILGEGSLSDRDRKYLEFADYFENNVINQGYYTDRSIEDSLAVAWKALSILPKRELKKLKTEMIDTYLPSSES